MNNSTFYQIHSDIFCTHDGPVTQFVAINRSMELAASKEYSAEDIANVLYEGLQGFQELPSTEFPQYSYTFSRD